MKKYAMFLVGLLLALQVALGGCSAPLGSPAPGVTPSITPVSFTSTPEPQLISYPFSAKIIDSVLMTKSELESAIQDTSDLDKIISQERYIFEINVQMYPSREGDRPFFEAFWRTIKQEYDAAFFEDHCLFVFKTKGLYDFSAEIKSVIRTGHTITINGEYCRGRAEALYTSHFIFIECDKILQPTDQVRFNLIEKEPIQVQ
nr:hypothetical protein [bacterium]